MVGNLDWIFWDFKRRRLIIAEEKTHGAQVKTWFRRMMLEIFEPALRAHCAANGIEFKGFHVITFEATSPDVLIRHLTLSGPGVTGSRYG